MSEQDAFQIIAKEEKQAEEQIKTTYIELEFSLIYEEGDERYKLTVTHKDVFWYVFDKRTLSWYYRTSTARIPREALKQALEGYQKVFAKGVKKNAGSV